MTIPWGSPVDRILAFARLFALDLEFLQLECQIGVGYFSFHNKKYGS